MSTYEEKLKTRREKLLSRATKAAQASQSAYQASRRATAGIEMGQPILVGHHSERRHRRDLARSDNAMRKSCDEQKKAEHYAQKAAAVGTGGISSDDPAALVKLRAELAQIEATQTRMKDANKAIRSGKTPEKQMANLAALGFSEEAAASLLKGDFAGRIGFASYQLSNNNANARRIKQRIADLEAIRSRQAVEVEGAGYRYKEDADENRVMFEFDGKPSEEVRSVLKSHAFKWSPSRGAWVRQLSSAGVYAGQQVRTALDALA